MSPKTRQRSKPPCLVVGLHGGAVGAPGAVGVGQALPGVGVAGVAPDGRLEAQDGGGGVTVQAIQGVARS